MNFLQPFLSAALALVAVPFLLHIFTRRKFIEAPFTALLFLRQSQRKSLRQFSLHHLLVLLCRAAAVAALAFAFMMPSIKGGRMIMPGGRARSALAVVLDNTYSMGWRKSGVSVFERARAAAVETLAAAGKDDEIIFITACGGAASAPLTSRAFTPAQLAAAAEKVSISQCSGPITPAINRAIYELERAGVPDRRVAVFTDMQARAFAGEIRKPESAAPEIMFADFSAPGAEAANVGFAAVTLPAFPLKGDTVPLCFELRGGSGGARPAVSLIVDGVPRGEQSVPVKTGRGGRHGASGCFRLSFPSAGFHYGYLLLQGDSLQQDNTYYFTLEVSGVLNVLLLSDRAALGDISADQFYIDAAFRAASSAGGGSSPFISRAVSPGDFSSGDLKDAGVVVIPGNTAVPRSKLEQLRQFALDGGGLFIISDGSAIPGELTDNLFFAGDTVLGSTAAGEKDEEGARAQFINASTFDSRHPAFSDFTKEMSAEISGTRFYSPARLTINSPEVRVLMRLANGNPVFVERKLGSGKAALLACGVNPYSSNASLKTYFVPLLVKTVMFLGKETSPGKRNFVLGDNIKLDFPAGASQNTVTAKRVGSGAGVIFSQEPGSGGASFNAQTRADAGVYRITSANDNSRAVDGFAVNLDPAEGNLAKISPDKFAGITRDYPSVTENASKRFDKDRAIAWAYNKGFTYLWIPFALCSFLFMGLDTIVSNRR